MDIYTLLVTKPHNPHYFIKCIPGAQPEGWILGNPKNPNKRLDK